MDLIDTVGIGEIEMTDKGSAVGFFGLIDSNLQPDDMTDNAVTVFVLVDCKAGVDWNFDSTVDNVD